MGIFLRRGPAPRKTRMSDLEIGRNVKLNLNGTPWDWLVVHQGLPSDLYDASCNGTWLLLKDIYERRKWDNDNVNKLEHSDIHSYLNGKFLNLFDSNVKDAIKQAKVPYRRSGGSGGTDQSGANGLLTKSFLLSGYEVGWTTSDSSDFPVDGTKLDYFTASSGGKSKRIANFNGSATYWWLRSPRTSDDGGVWFVDSDGNRYGDGGYASSRSYGIRPAIILPSDMIVTDDMLAA